MIYRTLREIKTLDRSNETLRWNRSLRDVGIRGLDQPEPKWPVRVACLVVGFTVSWIYLWLVLGWQ